MKDNLVFDAKLSARSTDENGFMHVGGSHITKSTVNPYYGREIPGWKEEGLDPDTVYYGFRDPRELKKSVHTWEGLPLHIEHHYDSADRPAKLTRVGAVGATDWNAPYVDAALTIWDNEAIAAVKDGSFRELSCAYYYDPDFTPGTYEGIEYDFVMRNIRGNHVALVEEGRAGADVVVADSALGADAQPRKENGEFGSGGNAATTPTTITGNELGEWRNVKELRQKAVAYYKEHLQSKPALRKDIGEIRFTKKGRNETEHFSADPDKLLMLPALRNIIETGQLGKEEKPKHPRKDDIVAFVPVTKTVNFKGKPRDVEVLLAKDRQGNLYYDLFLDNQRQQKTPARSWEQNPRWTGDMGETPVDLNIRILPATVNPTVDTRQLAADHNNRTGGLMSRFKKWFRGAMDADPDTEKKEVDLAQAIIDLHKVDPKTGEVVDVTEDEDKAAEIRKLVDGLAGKLDPEEVKRLTDALNDLAYSPATGDEDPEHTGMDEEMREAMDKCGLDADDPADSKAFAEGVKYGENLEKNPAEREKLDREHESEGMKKAMGDCGLDAENPVEAKAFAEGVKYGEEKEKAEPAKLDREHESEGMSKDDAKTDEVAKILDEVEGLTAEQRSQLMASFQDFALGNSTTDADPEEDPKGAQDRALKRRSRHLTAMDAARIKASAVADAQAHMRNLHRAVRDVRGLVGDLDPLAFDSASDVYGYALEQSGINPAKYARTAWRGMVDVLRSQKSGADSIRMARDSMPRKYDGKFAGLNNITISE